FFQAKFYADMSLNVYYFAISIYGWVYWSRAKSGGAGLKVSMVKARLAAILFVIFLVLFLGIGILLDRFTDSPVPYWDALTTSASIVATWMLTKKMLEHWLVWVFVDLVSMILYIYRGLYPTAILFALYTAMAVIGYRNWKRTF
ncbi:MAG TPA: nicotinamide riboside transporter PnuC, partial [Bacteroidales bacterium]|nr:nicotinamide riboside transporter PnuC [Bacteroidales bacterium]